MRLYNIKQNTSERAHATVWDLDIKRHGEMSVLHGMANRPAIAIPRLKKMDKLKSPFIAQISEDILKL